MSWAARFRLREWAHGSLWLVPLVAGVVGAAAGILISLVDQHVEVPSFWRDSPATATAVLTSIVGASAALTGFVVTVTVLAVQMAANTFSARYMRVWYRDGLLKATLGTLIATLTLSFILLRRVDDDFVPNIGVTVSAFLVTSSLVLFLVFFDRFIHRLRPVAVAALVAEAGRRAFVESLRVADHPDVAFESREDEDDRDVLLVRAARAGAIQAVDVLGLVGWARTNDARLVVGQAVGDFVSTGSALIRVYGFTGDRANGERQLRGMVALGAERTMQQDAAFGIRIMVDIAIRALSPAVNDPTTAVQVVDYLAELLQEIGTADLAAGKQAGGVRGPRVVLRARRWPEYLALALTEIREYGCDSVQTVRRLRAMLEELHENVRPEHREAVEHELSRLNATVEASWRGSVDLDLARARDGQGIGGPRMFRGAAG